MSGMKGKLGMLALMAGIMGDMNFAQVSKGSKKEIDFTPEQPPIPKGCKEYWFNSQGSFSNGGNSIPKSDVVYYCIASSIGLQGTNLIRIINHKIKIMANGKTGTGLFEGDNLLNQIVNISKAGAYDVLAEQVKELRSEIESLTSQNTILKETLEVFEKDREVLVSALQEFITFDLSDMEFTTDEDTQELKSIIAKAKQALQQVTQK